MQYPYLEVICDIYQIVNWLSFAPEGLAVKVPDRHGGRRSLAAGAWYPGGFATLQLLRDLLDAEQRDDVGCSGRAAFARFPVAHPLTQAALVRALHRVADGVHEFAQLFGGQHFHHTTEQSGWYVRIDGAAICQIHDQPSRIAVFDILRLLSLEQLPVQCQQLIVTPLDYIIERIVETFGQADFEAAVVTAGFGPNLFLGRWLKGVSWCLRKNSADYE
jgi:hypothetical protein